MVIAIGLEAADPDIIKKYCDQGHLPTFKHLIEHGFFEKALSPSSISSGSTWASVNTGVNPAKHGIGFYHRQLKNGTYEIVKKYADDIKVDPFWKAINGTGKRMAILDAPEIYPIENFDGIILAGWGGEALNFKRSSWPKSLLKDCIKKFGDHPLTGWYQRVPKDIDGWNDLLDMLQVGLKRREEMYASLLMQEDWDLFYATIAETHWVGHFFWHWIEQKHPDHDRKIAEKFEHSILKIYQMSDDLMARMIELKPDAQFIYFSNTGMGANFSGRHLVQDILIQMGLAPEKKSSVLPQKKYGLHGIKKVEDLIGARNIELVKRMVPEKLWDRWSRKFLTAGSDWNMSKVFEVPADYTSCLRINLIGREPNGLVSPGKEYEEICALIEQTFLQLINPATGKQAVSQVIKIQNIFHGEQINELPDLAIVWAGDEAIESLYSDTIKKVEGKLGDKRSGAHLPFGFIGIKDANIANASSRSYIVEDIAPTILQMMHIKASSPFDGNTIAEDTIKSEALNP